MSGRSQSMVISAVICSFVGDGIALAIFMGLMWRGHPLWVPAAMWAVYYPVTVVFFAPIGIVGGLVGGSFLWWRATLVDSARRLYLEATVLGAVLGFVLSGWIWWIFGVLGSVAGSICGALLVSFLAREELLLFRAAQTSH
jgi:H+/Cl- antiporter ClcA